VAESRAVAQATAEATASAFASALATIQSKCDCKAPSAKVGGGQSKEQPIPVGPPSPNSLAYPPTPSPARSPGSASGQVHSIVACCTLVPHTPGMLMAQGHQGSQPVYCVHLFSTALLLVLPVGLQQEGNQGSGNNPGGKDITYKENSQGSNNNKNNNSNNNSNNSSSNNNNNSNNIPGNSSGNESNGQGNSQENNKQGKSSGNSSDKVGNSDGNTKVNTNNGGGSSFSDSHGLPSFGTSRCFGWMHSMCCQSWDGSSDKCNFLG